MLAIRTQRDNQMTTAAMTESTTPAIPASAAPLHLGLRALLIVAALFEVFQALPSVPILFG